LAYGATEKAFSVAPYAKSNPALILGVGTPTPRIRAGIESVKILSVDL
jgi:hypothetical protein